MSAGSRENQPQDPIGRPESIRTLLDFVQKAGLADEQERQRNLDSKAGTLAGLVAVALSIEATLAASVLDRTQLASAAKVIFVGCSTMAILGLALSALLLVIGVLVPQPYPGLADDALNDLATRAEMEAEEAHLLGRQLSTVADTTLQTRERNATKAGRLRLGSIVFAGAIVAIAGQGLTLAFA
jgi:hypothetical protein